MAPAAPATTTIPSAPTTLSVATTPSVATPNSGTTAALGEAASIWSDKNIHRAADIAVIAQAILAFVAALIAYFTLRANGSENRKWKTLDVCSQYEFNDRIANAADLLRQAPMQSAPQAYPWNNLRDPATIVLNYLDGIAIGVEQGLYIESLAKDHLRSIVQTHVTNLLDSTRQHQIGLVRNDFRFLVDMNQEWTRDKPFFRSTWRLLPR